MNSPWLARCAARQWISCLVKPCRWKCPQPRRSFWKARFRRTAVEPEGPFGEYTGYMGPAGNEPFFNIKCMTFRNKPLVSGLHQPDAAFGVELHSRRRPRVAAF